ncbi:DUF89 domain protein, partial [Thamnocephalis sphaerospora]
RRLRTCFTRTKHWQTYDPFARQKQDALSHSAASVNSLTARFHALLRDTTICDAATQQELFSELNLVSLWGNRTDLSLLPEMSAEQAAHLQTAHKSEDAHHHILANDSMRLWELVKPLKQARVDIILDNAGFELFCDLLFADWFVQCGRARTVHLHAKCIPWFVSDVTAADFAWMLDALVSNETFTSLPHANMLAEMVARWREHIATGRWQLVTDPFWTLPYAYWRMPEKAPALWRDLCQSALCIYKGDLNYRKLVYDCTWPHETPFVSAIGPLHTAPDAPPLVALRTCKADVVVGLAPGQAEQVSQAHDNWMVSGEFAVVQLSVADAGQIEA